MNAGHGSGWKRPALIYCSNVHSGTTFEMVVEDVLPCLARVKKIRQLESMGTGLWLANEIATELVSDPTRLKQFKDHLREKDIDLFTLNGFPYGHFHQESVKTRVYRPNWSEGIRFDYSLNLARILAACSPAHLQTGTISTLPLVLPS